MDDHGDEEDLFDLDFGDVPVNTFQQLEQDAITLSQRPREAQIGRQQAADWHARQAFEGAASQHAESDIENPPPPPSSDYGYDEEDVIDLNDPTFTFGRDAPPIIAFRTAPVNLRKPINLNISKPEAPNEVRNADSADLERLQVRVTELESDRIRLNDALDNLRSESVTKDGAIANLRSRNQRSINEYEAKIVALQKLHVEESARLKGEIRTARNDQENIKTSNRFLEHDLAEERERLKRLKATVSNEPGITGNKSSKVTTATTPKKAHSFAFRDGFDDHEIVTISPTKSRTGERLGTPKAGQKRKRNAIASPSVAPGNSPAPTQSPNRPPPSDVDVEQELVALSELTIRDERIRIIQSALSHRCLNGQRTLEALSRYSLPGSGEATLASMMLGALSRISLDDTLPTSVAIRSACLNLWEHCLVSRVFPPLPLILSLFESMLQTEMSTRQVMLFERLLPLVARTSVIVAEPRVEALKEAATPIVPPLKVPEAIDDFPIISLFHQVAISAALTPEIPSKFWYRVEFTFIMLMLNPAQPMPHLNIMLEIVSTSILEDSFGPRHGSLETQLRQESDLLERLTSLLGESCTDSNAQRKESLDALLGLRLRVLQTLRSISITEHGSRALANNKTALGRLTRHVCDQITLLYSTPPLPVPEMVRLPPDSTTMGAEASKMATRHDKIIATVNLSIRIIHHLLQNHDIILDDKLSIIRSGKGKLVIALSRIAFSERSLLEAGLEDQVVDAANEILDLMLNPEEGEAIVQVMETPGAVHSGRTSLSASQPRIENGR